jgi:hypothetical protein
MKYEKKVLMIVGIIIGLISTLARLSIMGWLFLFGLISAGIFGIIHLLFLAQISKYFSQLGNIEKRIAWIGILTYPLIFLFQFDFGDSAGSFYVYEYLTGDRNSTFDNYAFYLAFVAAITYIAIFVIWRIKIRRLKIN